jgi:hypothetical protein
MSLVVEPPRPPQQQMTDRRSGICLHCSFLLRRGAQKNNGEFGERARLRADRMISIPGSVGSGGDPMLANSKKARHLRRAPS